MWKANESGGAMQWEEAWVKQVGKLCLTVVRGVILMQSNILGWLDPANGNMLLRNISNHLPVNTSNIQQD